MKTLVFHRDPSFQLRELLDILSANGRSRDGYTLTHHSEGKTNSCNDPLYEGTAGGYYWTIDPEYHCGFTEEGDSKVLGMLISRLTCPEWGIVNWDGNVAQRIKWDLTHLLVKRTSSGHPGIPEKNVSPRDPVEYQIALVRAQVELPHGSGVGYSEHPGTALLIAYLQAWGLTGKPEYPKGFFTGLKNPQMVKLRPNQEIWTH